MCECVGLESAERRWFGANGLGVTVTKGWIVPKEIMFIWLFYCYMPFIKIFWFRFIFSFAFLLLFTQMEKLKLDYKFLCEEQKCGKKEIKSFV